MHFSLSVQYKRNPARCQLRTVRGVTKTRGFLHRDQNFLKATQNSLCRGVNRRRGRCACRASSCRRRAKFSRTRSSRERKELAIHPRRCRSDTIMARILSELSEIQFCAKSFILQMYDVLARHNPTGDMFMHNVTLWFACPWTLSVYVVQGGALGMIVIGTMYLALGRTVQLPPQGGEASLWLCIAGLIAVFLTGYVGYFVVDNIWPTFYYTPVAAGKNVWLAAQAFSIVLYWLGVITVLLNTREITHHAVQA